MKVALYEKATGRFVQLGIGDSIDEWREVCTPAYDALEVGDSVLVSNTHYLFLGTNRVRKYPEPPSPTAVFDYSTGKWREP